MALAVGDSFYRQPRQPSSAVDDRGDGVAAETFLENNNSDAVWERSSEDDGGHHAGDVWVSLLSSAGGVGFILVDQHADYGDVSESVNEDGVRKAPKSVEIEASTTEEAIDAALKHLGVKKDQVSVRVLSEEQRGLFGMRGAKPVKVRVTVKETIRSS